MTEEKEQSNQDVLRAVLDDPSDYVMVVELALRFEQLLQIMEESDE